MPSKKENVTFPVPYRDWDQGCHSMAEFSRSYSNTEREMIWCFAVTMSFTMAMFSPLLYTGWYIYYGCRLRLFMIIIDTKNLNVYIQLATSTEGMSS